MMSNNIYYHGRARLPLRATSFFYCPDLSVQAELTTQRKPPTQIPHLARVCLEKGITYPSPPQPTSVPHTSHLSKREYSRLWRWVQVRPGMRREEQPRQRVRFTEGSLGAEAGGGLDARSPSLVLPPSRSLPGSITPLTAVIQAASLWSSPCGSKISRAPGSLDPERGRSGRPGGVSRHWGLSALGSPPCVRCGLTWYKKLSLWKASRSFTGPAIRAARALHTRPSTGPAPRLATPPASAQDLLGIVVPGAKCAPFFLAFLSLAPPCGLPDPTICKSTPPLQSPGASS